MHRNEMVHKCTLRKFHLLHIAMFRPYFLGFWRMLSGLTGAAAFIAGGALSSNVVARRPQLASTTTAIYFAGGGVGFILCGVGIPLLLDASGPSAWPQA